MQPIGKSSALSELLCRAQTAPEAGRPGRVAVPPDCGPPEPQEPSAKRRNLPSLSPPFQVGPSPQQPGRPGPHPLPSGGPTAPAAVRGSALPGAGTGLGRMRSGRRAPPCPDLAKLR